MDAKEQKELIMRNASEVIGEEQLDEMLAGKNGKKELITYCGYETSGEVHLGHLVTITKLMDLEKAGVKVKILFADWHTWLNMKGDWKFIHEQIEIWKKAFKAAGLKNPEYVLGSDFQRTIEYIDDVMLLAQGTTMKRALRSMQQVARDIEHAHVSQVMYPLMQIVDIKHLDIDIVQAGIEQRKIHMLGLEMFEKIKYKKPVFVHTPLIPSLSGAGKMDAKVDTGSKMSSSDPNSHISVRDSPDDVRRKLKKAHCPEGEKEENPILMLAQLLVFPRLDELMIERPEKFGGNVTFKSYEELEEAFVKKELHPMDLKNAVGEELIKILEPIRKVFGVE